MKKYGLVFLLSTTLLTGCISNDDYSKVVNEFQESSNTLTAAYQSLLTHANLIEQNQFIDEQVFEAKPIDPASIKAHAILTDDEIKLRVSAIKALTDYTCALATLAAGKSAAQIETDAAKASTSLGKLSTDAATAIVKPAAGSTAPDYSTPVSAAVTAIGDVIGLIEKHRGENEVKESLRKNDPQVTALFAMLSDESTSLFERQKTALGQTGAIVFRNYAVARGQTPPKTAELLQFSDRIKQYQSETTLIADSDPSHAIRSFQDSHDKLVKAILAPKDKKKQSLAELIASVRSFAAEVTPLAQKSTVPAGSL